MNNKHHFCKSVCVGVCVFLRMDVVEEFSELRVAHLNSVL